MNTEFYGNDQERWKEIDGVKTKVAEHLQIPKGSKVLDVLVGEADFSRAIARSSEGSLVVAGEILDSDLKEARRRVERDGLKKRIELLRIDITCMAFAKDSFDCVVNFTGWEDFTAVSGEEFVDTAFSEMVRVLRPEGVLAVTFIPALEPKDEISKKDIKLQEYMYKSRKRPKYFHEDLFLGMFRKHGIRFLEKNSFKTRKNRLSPEDAKSFIQWSCRNYKRFYAPDVTMRSYLDIEQHFGKFIEKYGIREPRSKFVLLAGHKLKDEKTKWSAKR